jgi:hypothetical protein
MRELNEQELELATGGTTSSAHGTAIHGTSSAASHASVKGGKGTVAGLHLDHYVPVKCHLPVHAGDWHSLDRLHLRHW